MGNRKIRAWRAARVPLNWFLMVAVISKRTPRQVQKEIQEITKASNKINKSASSARTFLKKHGFITETCKISKRYR
jgi:hypothetical protein